MPEELQTTFLSLVQGNLYRSCLFPNAIMTDIGLQKYALSYTMINHVAKQIYIVSWTQDQKVWSSSPTTGEVTDG